MNQEQIKAAREALDSMDDYARMNTGVDAIGPRGALEAFISEVEKYGSTFDGAAPDTSQDWANLDGAVAWHLIERHADSWSEVGNMMESWLAARMAAAPVPIQKASPVPLFDRKLENLQQRGYEVIGRILHKDGEYALFDSSTRWLTQPQYWRLMHEQDGSLFATPPALAGSQVQAAGDEVNEREAFEAMVKERFVTTEHSLARAHPYGYYNTVSSNTFGGRRQPDYANVQMLWDVWDARATIAKKAMREQP